MSKRMHLKVQTHTLGGWEPPAAEDTWEVLARSAMGLVGLLSCIFAAFLLYRWKRRRDLGARLNDDGLGVEMSGRRVLAPRI